MPENTVFIAVLCTCVVYDRQLDFSCLVAFRQKRHEGDRMRMNVLKWIGAAGLSSLALASACVVPDSASNVNGGYYPGIAPANASVSTPQPYAVSTMPPDPLYEQMTPSPGYGQVWIDGSWHWNGYEWVWVSGRWEQ